eukprot:CAMPEP_0183520724 /NCGR_PEP_ID=MMETSP0371-20130417/17148_1 /TAXON_ID=268820 /ORGANISM="Peridinium aciculiferum, Strain PAER-2" /LENGTH=123 /DNA_ID=CAMNT_0025719145 /DNA_START=67 /DNA_END=437 /DNA_ORIENTATION=-
MTAAAGLSTEVLAQLPVRRIRLHDFVLPLGVPMASTFGLSLSLREGRDAVHRSECAASASSGRLFRAPLAAKGCRSGLVGHAAVWAIRAPKRGEKCPVGRPAAKFARAADDMAQTAGGVLACG